MEACCQLMNSSGIPFIAWCHFFLVILFLLRGEKVKASAFLADSQTDAAVIVVVCHRQDMWDFYCHCPAGDVHSCTVQSLKLLGNSSEFNLKFKLEMWFEEIFSRELEFHSTTLMAFLSNFVSGHNHNNGEKNPKDCSNLSGGKRPLRERPVPSGNNFSFSFYWALVENSFIFVVFLVPEWQPVEWWMSSVDSSVCVSVDDPTAVAAVWWCWSWPGEFHRSLTSFWHTYTTYFLSIRRFGLLRQLAT